jgi:hypothetical protein
MVRKLKYSGTIMLIEVQWDHVSHNSKIRVLNGKLKINLWTTHLTYFVRFQILKT